MVKDHLYNSTQKSVFGFGKDDSVILICTYGEMVPGPLDGLH